MEEHKTPPFGVDHAELEEILDGSDLLVEDSDATPLPDAAFLQSLPTPRPEEDTAEDRLERQITVQPVSELLGSTPAFTVTEPPPAAQGGLQPPDPADELDFSDLMELTDGPGRPPPARAASSAEPVRTKREWVPPVRSDGGPTVIEFEADSEYDMDEPPPPPAPPGRVSFRPEPEDSAGEFADIPTRNVNLTALADKLRDEEWSEHEDPDAIELGLPPPPPPAPAAAARHEPQTLEIGPEAIVALHLARARELLEAGDVEAATEAAEQAMAADFEGVVLRGEREKQLLLRVFEARLGASNRLPQVIMKQPDLGKVGLDHRRAFLLDRIDGNTTVEDLLAVSGVGRLEAYRTLCWLLRRGVIDML